jgi:hypothetical protein
MQGRQSLAARASAMFQSLQFSFGFGQVPQMHAAIPQVRFDQLDYELGALSAEVYQPLNRFLETQVHSQQYGNENNQQPLVDSFRELAIVYPLTLWLLRILAYGRNPTADDAVAAIVSIERGRGMQGFHSIAKSLGESGQLERLIVWLAR